jgi:type II secretion system protein N
MIQRIGMGLFGVVWGALVFQLAFHMSFPSEALGDRMAYEVEQATDGKQLLRVEKAVPWGVLGVSLKGVQLFSRAKGSARDEESAGPHLRLALDKFAARLRAWPLLGGTRSVELDTRLYDGRIAGEVYQSSDGSGMNLKIRGLDLSAYPIESDSFQVGLEGRLKGVIKLAIDGEDASKSKGRIRLSVDGLALNHASFGGFELEPTTFDEAVIQLEVDDGRLKVKKGKIESDVIRLVLEGDIVLQEPMDRSRVRLKVRFKLSEEMDDLAKILPQMKRARDSGGEYHFQVTGTVANWRFREDRSAARGKTSSRADRRSTSGSVTRGSEDSEAEEDEAEEDEARKERREARIRERRERMRDRRSKRESDEEGSPEEEARDKKVMRRPEPEDDPDLEYDDLDDEPERPTRYRDFGPDDEGPAPYEAGPPDDEFGNVPLDGDYDPDAVYDD